MSCPTGKRPYSSRRAARRAHAKARNKIRVYFCNACHGYHATGNVGGARR